MKLMFALVCMAVVLQLVAADPFTDGDQEFTAKDNICKKIISPALDDAIFKSTDGESTKKLVEDTIHALPAQYRYDLEKHEVVEHPEKDSTCEIVREEINQLMWDPHTVAGLAALVSMFHKNPATKHHLRRLIEHSICISGGEVGKEDGQFHDLLQEHMRVTEEEQDKHGLRHDWEYDAPPAGHIPSENRPEEEVRELTKQELEEMQMEGHEHNMDGHSAEEDHENMQHGTHDDSEIPMHGNDAGSWYHGGAGDEQPEGAEGLGGAGAGPSMGAPEGDF